MKLKLTVLLGVMALIAFSTLLPADFVQCPGESQCDGTANSDIINGSPLFDVIVGELGDDIVFGNDGPDSIYSQDDNDIAFGGNGSDWLDTGEGDDKLLPGPDDGIFHQTAVGGPDNDSFYTFASETSTCLYLAGDDGQDVAHLIGLGPYTAQQPFGQTGWVDGWVLAVDPISGGNILIWVTEDDDSGVETIHGLPSPNVTIIDLDGLSALDCPEYHPDIEE
jgi:Ca2+-binding RTX toxin-like protein